jgi:hypothetical protein
MKRMTCLLPSCRACPHTAPNAYTTLPTIVQVLEEQKQIEVKDALLAELQADLKVVGKEVNGLKRAIDGIKPRGGAG